MIEMEEPNNERLALIHGTIETESGEKHIFGTGYFVTRDLVLTARHVLYDKENLSLPVEKIEVRPETPIEGQKDAWIEAEQTAVWENTNLDAALIRVVRPISADVLSTNWGDGRFEKGQVWASAAYPKAAAEKTAEGVNSKTSGLDGKVLRGGGGQGQRRIELGVDYEADFWEGISGAPVFVNQKLNGIIINSLGDFGERRLEATPVELMLDQPGFREAVAPKWLDPLPQTNWILILNTEREYPKLKDFVGAAIKKKNEDIKHKIGEPINDGENLLPPLPFRSVTVTEALENPGRLFQFIKAICAAPIMIFDVTDFEPAIMMFLGIRAVVRRGVTLTTTTKILDESLLSELPFNIQETKLIRLSLEEKITSDKHPINWIGSAIVEGLTQLQSHSNYQDLPAYNAVRCPELLTSNNALMLCSFHKDYKDYWRYLSNEIAIKVSPKSLERMLDISSPRLVGLALYESIRWTPCCIIDWTQWRANVFFELGVRLACSQTGPICLIEEEEEIRDEVVLTQRNQLIQLLNPTKYKLDGSPEPFDKAFERYDAIINEQHVPIDDSAIAHNAIYQAIENSYFWQQESISKLPYEELRDSIYAQVGRDPEKVGNSQVLFSSNSEFSAELARNIRERWIAAWYYFKGRYSPEEFSSNRELQEQLKTLGEEVARYLVKKPGYERIYKEIKEVIFDKKNK